jgi:hypothetical protein
VKIDGYTYYFFISRMLVQENSPFNASDNSATRAEVRYAAILAFLLGIVFGLGAAALLRMA